MENTPVAMIQHFIQRWFCGRFAPLLTAYVEGGLNEKQQAKVAVHIKTCAACRQEVEELTELGKLLRAHPPAVPQLKPDLWSRIQAEIVAESAAQPEPERPAQPLRRQPAPNFQWANFGLSFATTGTLVTAAVVGVVVLTKPLLRPASMPEPVAKESVTNLAVVTPDRDAITMEFRDALKPGAKASAKPAAKAVATVPAPATATPSEVRPVQPVQAPQIAIARRRVRHSSRSMNVQITRPLRPIASPTEKQYVAVAHTEEGKNKQTFLAEPADKTPTVAPEPTTVAATSEADKPIDMTTATKVASAASDSLETDATEVVAPRVVPASGFVNDTAKIRAKSILFVYSGR